MASKQTKKTSKQPKKIGTAKRAELKTITLPSSKVKIQFASDFDKEKLADLTRELTVNDGLAAQMRANPSKALAKVGIFIDDEDRRLINDEDMLAAMGHRAGAQFIGPAFVVVVVVAVVNFPGPAY